MIVLNAYGRFRLIDDDGDDLTPISMKARGLIALLALSKDLSRPREWLQDKLWSDRPAKQGAESLRQVLAIIRRSFGSRAHVLIADRTSVSLDPRQFRIVFERPVKPQYTEIDRELFGDLAVPDLEFENWIREQREAHAVSSRICDAASGTRWLPRNNPAIFFRVGAGDEEGSGTVRHMLSLATASLLDFSDFQIFQEAATPLLQKPVAPQYGIEVDVNSAVRLGSRQLVVMIRDASSTRVLWTRTFEIGSDATPEGADEDQIHEVCAQVVEAILTTFRTHGDDLGIPECAAMLANRGRNLIFRYDKRSLVEADKLLWLAYWYEPRAQYLAWRSFLRNMANFQHRSHSFLGDTIDVETLAREAIHQAPSSAIALGVGAHIEYLCGGSQRSAQQLARRAIGYDPLNAINHAILSNAELVMGNLEDSRRLSLKALSLSGGGDHRSFMEFFCCMSAAALGDYHAAIDHAEAALILRPTFRAPLRYLVALYKYMGRTDQMHRAILRMRSAEPDFQVSHFLDDTYPVTTLRRMRLIDAIAGGRTSDH